MTLATHDSSAQCSVHIEAGLDADLLVFDRDPLGQPSVLHNPLLVMSNGRVAVNRQVGLMKVLPNH